MSARKRSRLSNEDEIVGEVVGGTPLCLITANVGSIFEIPSLMPTWVDEIASTIASQQAQFVAIHMQEVGGKKASTCKPALRKLVKILRTHASMTGFGRCFGYFDTDVEADDEYTALGSLYFVHQSLKQVERYNYDSKEFTQVAGPADESDLQFDTNCPYHAKTKFYVGQFGRKRASRKGYLQTNWMLGDQKLHLINLHLFADESNLDAAKRSPSQYARWRHSALKYILDHTLSDTKVTNDATQLIPNGTKRSKRTKIELRGESFTYLFGDFNFRLALGDLLMHICEGARAQFERAGPEHSPHRSRYFKRGTRELLLTLERKKFLLANEDICKSEDQSIRKFDFELDDFVELKEFPIIFSPSYPFSENAHEPQTYNTMRAPAWCDRVIMTEAAKALAANGTPSYEIIGQDSCMGDHKPVCLSFNLNSLTI